MQDELRHLYEGLPEKINGDKLKTRIRAYDNHPVSCPAAKCCLAPPRR
jgi:hypothetical protein